MPTIDESYDNFPRIEKAFRAALDESLHPRGPDMLYEIVGGLGLTSDAAVLDLGCGEGRQAIELARRFGLSVLGVDPVQRNIDVARTAAAQIPGVRFDLGSAEAIPVEDATIDLVWCREALYFPPLDEGFAESRRVLRSGGHMLIYYNLAGDRLEPHEAAWQWSIEGVSPANVDTGQVEAAIARAGFRIEQRMDLGSEFAEHSQETTGEPGRRLLHAARLLRAPERYIAQFGQVNYDIMLADCFWHVYRMISKLTSRVYLLRAP